MPQVSAAVLRSTPSSTSASASIRRAAALSFSPLAALRSSEAVRSSRVIDTAAPIDAAPLKGQHRVRVSLIWESPMSHSFGPLVSDLILRSIAKRCVSMDAANEVENALRAKIRCHRPEPGQIHHDFVASAKPHRLHEASGQDDLTCAQAFAAGGEMIGEPRQCMMGMAE